MPLEVTQVRVAYSETRLVLPMGRLITKLKVGDTRPVLAAQLVDPSGLPHPLAGKTVTFFMRKRTTRATKVNAAASIVSYDGQVQYAWQAADTNEAGVYEARFVTDDNSGGITSFPNAGWHEVLIEP